MQFIKPTFLKLLLAITLFTACNGNEEKQTDSKVVKKDSLSEVKPDEIIKEDDKSVIKPENSSTSGLEGAWEIKRAVGSSVKSNLGTVYTFEGDILMLGKGGFNNPGKTEITDSTFSFQPDNNSYKFMYDYKFDGDTLVVTVKNSNGQTFYMVKK